MTVLENRPEVLQRLLDRLWARYEHGTGLTGLEHEALIEASFRLGVHRDTEPATALTLLARAHRLDPTDPKHPYHIGLIYLRHGRLEAAQTWLTAAATLSPTNHRVWAHLSLIQRGLDERRTGTADYDGDYRRRADEIVTAIREGRDDLDPAATPPLRRPGECRWPGVHDLEVEARLRSKTSERTRDAVAGRLADLARSADRRRGGTAAFCVLAVQWMVSGYPPATIRRLAADLPAGDGPAMRLLNRVCDLFEADEADLPDRLARCLADKSLPDLLTAMIHRHRLFHRPLRLPDLGAYTVATQFSDGDPARSISAMTTTFRALCAPPPEPMADVQQASSSTPGQATSPDEKLVRLEQAAAQLSGLIAQVLAAAKGLDYKGKPVAILAGAAGDCATLLQAVDRIETLREKRLAELADLTAAEPEGLVMPFDEYHRRVGECGPLLQESTGPIKKRLRATEKALKKQQGFESVTPAPSGGTRAISDALTRAEIAHSGAPGATAAPDRRPPAAAPVAPRLGGTPAEQLAAAVTAVEEALADNFDTAWRTLGAYPPHLRDRHAVVLLRAFLNGHQAEADHRMGQPAAARRRWSSMLAEDPLSLATIRNLAVAHSSAGDLGAATQAWSRYLETLYQHDMLSGDPRRGAAHRAEVHKILAGSFGTAALVARTTRDGDTNEDVADLPPVLASRARTTIATAHLRLEELNRALSNRSPTLLLGVGRSIGEPELAAARDRRTAFAEASTAALSPRIRDAFTELCRTSIASAYEAATEAGGRIRRPTDEAEEEEHAAWAKERILWKLRVRKGVAVNDADWALTEYSGDLIGNLQLVDDLVLDPLDDFVLRAAQQLGISGDAKGLLEELNQLSDLACEFALRRIFKAAEEGAGTFPDTFRRIGRSWARNAIPDQYLELLDDPQMVYYPSAESAFAILAGIQGELSEQDRRVVEAAVVPLERWIARLPGATGPARALARMLGALGRDADAQRVLSMAEAEAFAPHGRREISISYVRLAIDRARYPEAVTIVRRLLHEGTAEPRLRRLLAEAYNRWISTGHAVPDTDRIKADLAPWSEDPEAVRECRVLVTNATIVKHRSTPDGIRITALGRDLRHLCADDPGNTEALFHLVVVLHQNSLQVRMEMRRAYGAERDRLRAKLDTINAECGEKGDLVLADATFSDEARRNEVQSILKAVRR